MPWSEHCGSAATPSKDGDITVGKFVDRDRPDFQELTRSHFTEQLKDKFVEAEEPTHAKP